MSLMPGLLGVSLPAAAPTAVSGAPADAENVVGEATGALFAGLVAQQETPAQALPAAKEGDKPAEAPLAATVTDLQMAVQAAGTVAVTARNGDTGKPAIALPPTPTGIVEGSLPALAPKLAGASSAAVAGPAPAVVSPVATPEIASATPASSYAAPTLEQPTTTAPQPTTGEIPGETAAVQDLATYDPGSRSPGLAVQPRDQAPTGGENPRADAGPDRIPEIPNTGQAAADQSSTDQSSTNRATPPPAPVAVDGSPTVVSGDEMSAAGVSAPESTPAVAEASARPAGTTGTHAAPRNAASPAPTATTSQAVRSQVMHGVEPALAKGSMQELSIQLDPEDLGRVEIRFQATGHRLAVTIIASGAAAERVLRDGASELGEAIAQRSARFQNVEVRVETRDNDQRDQQRQDTKRDESAKGSNRDQGGGRRGSARGPQTTAEAWADLAQGG